MKQLSTQIVLELCRFVQCYRFSRVHGTKENWHYKVKLSLLTVSIKSCVDCFTQLTNISHVTSEACQMMFCLK